MGILLTTAAIVGKKEHQGLLGNPRVIEGLQDPTDPLVHRINHRGINRHAKRLPFLVLLFFPGADPGFALGPFPLRIDQPHADHALVAFIPEFLPAAEIAFFVACDIFRLGVKRIMRRRVADVDQERIGSL